MTPIIYTYGGGEYLNSLFQSLSILFDFGKHSEIIWLGRISALLGVVWLSISGFASRGKDGSPGAIDWTWFLRFAMIWIVLIVPKTTLEIQDRITKANYSVSNAPWSLSIFGWFTSSLGYGLTDMYENVLGGGMNAATSYSGNGVAFGSSYYNSLPKVARFEPMSSSSAVFPFIQECLIPAAGPINSTWSGITKKVFLTSPNYYAAIMGLSTNFLQNRYVNVEGTSVTCLTLRDNVINDWNNNSQILMSQMRIQESNIQTLDAAYVLQATTQQSNSLKQAMMMNAIQDATAAGSAQWGDTAMADSIYQAQAQYQQTTAWRQGSQFASVSLVWLHVVAECLAYAIFPLLIFLILLPVGFSILMEYLKVLFWLQTWPILYAIFNSIIAVYATSRSQQLAMQYGGFTMSNFYKIGDINDGIVSTAGYLTTLVPVLSWMFLQRAGVAIAGAVGSFTGSTNNSADQAGKQETLGNLDVNRMSYGGNRDTTTTTKIGEDRTSIQGSGVTYDTQGGITTAREEQMSLLSTFTSTHGKQATTTVALNNAISQQQESAIANSHAVSNILTSARGNDSSEQFKNDITKAISYSSSASSRDSSSNTRNDSSINSTSAGINVGGSVLTGIGAGTGAAIGAAFGGVGAVPGAIVGAAVAKIGSMLKADTQWRTQHQNDLASKSDSEVGQAAANEIAVKYAQSKGYSETSSFQQQSQQADQSLSSFKAASSKVDTYSKMAQNSESNSATESDTSQVMRDKFNRHIQEGMNFDQAKAQTVADMHELVNKMPMNTITPIKDGSTRNSSLGHQWFDKVDDGNAAVKQGVMAQVPTEQKVLNENSNTINEANKTTNATNQKTSEFDKPTSAKVSELYKTTVKPTLKSVTDNAREQAKAGKVQTWGSGKQ